MDSEQPDSLEGWVPLREDLFSEPERHQLRFLVAWNAAKGQFAVTCHDRTAQRRRRERREAGDGGCSWAGVLSPAGFRGAHRQLAALWPALEPCFPPLPPELDAVSGAGWGLGRGLWALLWPLLWPAPADPGDSALQELCRQLEHYLGLAAEGCGGATVRDVLFPAPGDSADCEGLSEFRERTLRARLGQTATRLHQVLQDHGKANTMVALMKVYQEEDELYQELVTMATTFFQYLLQPFRDMREVATSCKLGILKSLDEDELGPRRVAALQKEASEWTRRAEEAVGSIQDITVNYFKETVTALTGMQKQMEQDQKRFGQAAWATAMPRLENLKLMLARETLQLMRAKELCLKHRQAEIQRKVEDLPHQGKQLDVVDELEIQCYEVQLELYDVKLEMLRNEETILVTRLDSVKRLITEKQAEVTYYDPCESPEELQSLAPDLELHLGDNRELRALSQQCQRLEAQRGRICSRRALLRNRKDHCRENHQLRLQQAKQSVRRLHQHHSIQMKRDKVKEEEQKKKEWIDHERQKTLERLRAYKEKCPAHQSALKTTCSKSMVSNLSGGRSQKRLSTAHHHKTAHPASSKTGSAVPLPEASVRPPEHQDPCGSVPVQAFVPVSDQTLSGSSEDLSQPPQPPPPPPLPPPPPPPLPPALSSFQGTTHQNLGLRTLATEDRPLPLACDPSAGRPCDCQEGFQGPGSMDEVLASLRQGKASLRKVETPTLPRPGTSVNEQVLAAIRQGVRLKKVHMGQGVDPGKKSTSDLERSIREALERIKKVSADSEEDNDEPSPTEWDH
ncbi:WASP homolog-associated protein with actin, membranes and microtubules [Mus caroli]|uniref:WASP homolog-associated protein with actin, membranes and microtubules n=1 Tax=Mus caroli TaxID=10089 RepID=A0A6P5QAI3_MUSCR|nr:WASP homolog-associated protein with actin, membranes and microtubules [Mus caroli]